MHKPTIIFLVGLPGSGKSRYAKKLAEEIGASVYSSDAIRLELYGDDGDQSHNGIVFGELHKRIRECLKSGNNAVYDATNIKSKTRIGFVKSFGGVDCHKKCIIMATPYEQCVANNAERDRKVPEFVIERMYRKWNTPYWFEGWDSIEIKYWKDSRRSVDAIGLLRSAVGFEQDNPHHSLGLGEHLLRTYSLVPDECDLSVSYAASLHDVGKMKCKTYTDYKNRPCEYAHYYNHENIGAYDALFFDYYANQDDDMTLLVSTLINLHMRPYVFEKADDPKRSYDKHRNLWGERLFDSVMCLHDADKNAH